MSNRHIRSASAGELYHAQKYPSGLNRKWSESSVLIDCGKCGGTSCKTDVSGELVMLACTNCANWWVGAADSVFKQYETQEVYITIPEHFDEA